MTQPQNPWRNRTRRLLWFFGASTTIYIALNYALDRMKEARLRSLKERREKDLLKQHFTSLISTISSTLYALLPTLQPQLSEDYPVEQISQALQNLSNATSNNTSVMGESVDPTPDTSVVPQPPAPSTELPPSAESSGSPQQSIDQSWTSQFRTESVAESEQPSLVGESVIQVGDDDAASSTLSQSISLPPTDTSSFSPSPPSDQSQLHSSPPQPAQEAVSFPSPYAGKSKKELWRGLKVQTLTRSVTTAYLIPLLYLLTTSQLSTLARERYLNDVDDNLPEIDSSSRPASRPSPSTTKPKGMFSYFSSDAMGLGDFVEKHTPGFLNPGRYLPTAVSQYLPFTGTSSIEDAEAERAARLARKEELEAERAEDERVYLTYSWWILHEGWRGVAKRVEDAVEEVFGGMALKRELGMEDWHTLIREVRARVETQTSSSGTSLYSFVPHIMPTYPLSEMTSSDPNPLPSTPPTNRPHLSGLLEQTMQHLRSADTTYLIEKGVTTMTRKMLDTVKEDLYSGSEIGLILNNEVAPAADMTRRLVDCLPSVDRWGKAVWEAIPDTGIENLTAIPEFEAFAALIFGDWAPR